MPLTPDELLTTTRSVRKRLDLTRPVPLDLVKECLEIALQAPSGRMRQGWHWIVVTDPELRAQIGNFYRRSTESYLSNAAADPSLGAGTGSKVMARVSSSSAYLGQHMGRVPVQVIPCITVRSAWQAGESQAGLWGSLLPAAWSYMLACRARGLGTAWTTLHLQYETEIAGPRRFHPPPARPAGQQPGQQVPPLPRPSRICFGNGTADGADILGRD